MATKKRIDAIGLMSGTSADGVDVALLRTDGEADIEFLGGLTCPYEEDLRWRLIEASQHDVPLVELLRLEREITICHAEAVQKFLGALAPGSANPTIVGFHGHTVRHMPGESLTMQIGNPWLLAEQISIPVVSDFRRRDVAAGGQGAPLAAMFHQAIFAGEKPPLAVLNLGGVANVTWLGPDGRIIAGDTGPGCGLLDEWAQEMAGLSHDEDGRLSAKGQPQPALVKAALNAPFFKKSLPRSADRYEFDHIDVSMLSVEDGAATLCAVTTQAVYEAVKTLPAMPKTLWVTGGGVHHPVVMRMLGDLFGDVRSVEQRKLSPDTLEAECFAWLAVRHLKGLPLTVPETTGCSRPVTGGTITVA